jgi:hypothetical protein
MRNTETRMQNLQQKKGKEKKYPIPSTQEHCIIRLDYKSRRDWKVYSQIAFLKQTEKVENSDYR